MTKEVLGFLFVYLKSASKDKRRETRQPWAKQYIYLIVRMTRDATTGHSLDMTNQLDLVHGFLAVLALDDLLGRKVNIVFARG